MRLLDLTLDTAAENVALDEALLEEAERGATPAELLRLWEPQHPIVVIGRSSRAETEVRLDACARQGVPVVRRASGGAAIVTGPGCLMYALILSIEARADLKTIDTAHRFVLGRLAKAITSLVPGVSCNGTSDLTFLRENADWIPPNNKCGTRPMTQRKFSGNSVRLKQRHLLYHGTLLYNFDVATVDTLLAHPPREPAYRAGREHAKFVANLPTDGSALREALIAAWQAERTTEDWPRELTRKLAAEKYSSERWNLRGEAHG